MRIWHWQALKECKIKQKPNPPNCCDNCYLPHFLASFWRQTRFSTLPRQVLTWWWKLLIDQNSLWTLKVFHWCLKLPSKILPLKCSTWAWSDIQQGWHGPPPQVVTKTLQPKKVARIANLVICYSLLIWPEWCDSYVFLIHTAHPFKINAKSHLVRRLDNLDPTRRKRLCEENFCWCFLVHVLLRVRHRFHLNLLKNCHVITFLRPKVCHWSNAIETYWNRLNCTCLNY